RHQLGVGPQPVHADDLVALAQGEFSNHAANPAAASGNGNSHRGNAPGNEKGLTAQRAGESHVWQRGVYYSPPNCVLCVITNWGEAIVVASPLMLCQEQRMKIVDVKCAVIGDNPVVRLVTDEGLEGYGEAENSKPYLKPHILHYRQYL